MFAPPICRRCRRNASERSRSFETVVSSDSTKTAALPANIAASERAIGQRAQRAIGRRAERAIGRRATASGAIKYLRIALPLARAEAERADTLYRRRATNEVGELEGAIRAAAMFAPPICRRGRTKRVESGEDPSETAVSSGSNEDGGLPSEHRVERERSHWTSRAESEWSNQTLRIAPLACAEAERADTLYRRRATTK